jgi:hypothetical protein
MKIAIETGLILFVFFLLTGSRFEALASDRADIKSDELPITKPRKLTTFSGKTYPATMGGIDRMMEDLKTHNASIYRKLKPEYEDMKSDRTLHQILSWTLTLGGGALMLLAPQLAPDERGSGTKASTPLVIAGAAGLAGGITLLFLTPPSPDRIEKFKELHNSNNPSEPVRLSLQLTPSFFGAQAHLDF